MNGSKIIDGCMEWGLLDGTHKQKKKHKTNGLNERREGEVCRPRKRRKNGGD